MQVAYFEDGRVDQFRPLVWLRPVFELLCGHSGLRERVNRYLSPTTWGAFLRPWLVEAYAEEHPAAHFNQLDWLKSEPTLLLNGRWLPQLSQLKEIGPGDAVWQDGELAAVMISSGDVAELDLADIAASSTRVAQSRQAIPASGQWLNYPWDLVHWNGTQLSRTSALDRTDRVR